MRMRGPWPAIVLACLLHAFAIARTHLPSHDGLKLLRTAAEFQTHNPATVIRGSDRHPLYPALVALSQPLVARFTSGAESWRIAGQAVSALAGVALLVPLFVLTRAMFGSLVAHWACMLWVVLPMPAEVCREILSDSLALGLFTASLCCFEQAARKQSIGFAVAAGLWAGLGYWSRPEVALIAAVGVAAIASVRRPPWRRVLAALLPFAALVLAYAGIKGEISEKLALRRAMGLPPSAAPVSPRILQDATLRRFTPKAENDSDLVPQGFLPSALAIGQTWMRAMGLLLVPLALAGAILAPPSPGRRVVRWYTLAAAILLIRHVYSLHYLSIRHLFTFVLVALPWAAWRLVRLGERVNNWLRLDGMPRRLASGLFSIAIVVAGIVAQNKQVHDSHNGHWQAGRWLTVTSRSTDAVFDTHGWAAFVAERPWLDPWHLRQALADPHVRYAVVERGEVEGTTPRAEALRGVLVDRAILVNRFAQRAADGSDDVLVFEFRAQRVEDEAG